VKLCQITRLSGTLEHLRSGGKQDQSFSMSRRDSDGKPVSRDDFVGQYFNYNSPPPPACGKSCRP
jgi:hypothetical protein